MLRLSVWPIGCPSQELHAHEKDLDELSGSALHGWPIETILDVLHVGQCFPAIVSADDVHRGKPDPEVFLIAAGKLGVAPAYCIVVEDAEHGIEAAHAAGMKSIGVRQNGKHLPADIVVRSLDLLDEDAFNRLLWRASIPQ